MGPLGMSTSGELQKQVDLPTIPPTLSEEQPNGNHAHIRDQYPVSIVTYVHVVQLLSLLMQRAEIWPKANVERQFAKNVLHCTAGI
jgi:hypothetical protein